VAWRGARSVVCAASYEARVFGVRSAMPAVRAERLCPEAVFVPPDFTRYKAVSRHVREIFRRHTDLVEPLSLDEAFLDVTDPKIASPSATATAEAIRAQIREETALTASAGVAPNKFLAKIASGWRKPDGLTVIAPERVETFLQQLPVDALWGVGPVTARKLRARGIERLVDVRAIEAADLHAAVGSLAGWLRQLATGIDDRPVVPHRASKSSGSENTYPQDLTDLDAMRREIAGMAEGAAAWLSRHSLTARTVTIKVRYADFTTVTRSQTGPPTCDAAVVVARAVPLLDRTDAGRRAVRLLGVSVHNLCAAADGRGEPDRLPFDERSA
jgi:DNA polymerase-4